MNNAAKNVKDAAQNLLNVNVLDVVTKMLNVAKTVNLVVI